MSRGQRYTEADEAALAAELTTVQACGHRWSMPLWVCFAHPDEHHRCDQPPTHPGPHACRCGATTTRKDT